MSRAKVLPLGYITRKTLPFYSMVYTPHPLVKFLAVTYIWLLHHGCMQGRTIDPATQHISPSSPIIVKGAQQLLFCCLLHVLILHLPSFVWSFRIDVARCTALLEHILHYYFIMASVLSLVPCLLVPDPDSGNLSEMIVGTEMSLYYLWQIICKSNEQALGQKRKLHCTLFHGFMETFVLVFATVILPIFWLQNLAHSTESPHTQQFFLHAFSLLFFSEAASVVFRLVEVVVYPSLSAAL